MKPRKLIRKICAFSGKRGGFGAYVPLMQLIEKDPDLELQILLGDMHASPEFGRTVDEAKKFFPSAKIELIEMGTGRGDSRAARAENLGICLQKTANILEKLAPDIVLVHADRGEHLMVAFAALNLGIPIAHTQGGDISGNIDDIQRHAITKLAHLHFSETEEAAKRILEMGEEKWRVYNVGSTYIDRIAKKMYTSAKNVRQKYGLGAKEDFYIVIFHPDTYLTRQENYQQAKIVFQAVKKAGLRCFVLYPCSDPGYEGIVRAIDEIKNDTQFMIYKNIDNLDFLSLMSQTKAIIGNSSCALVEAPYFKLPAINIGRRQEGREGEENVIDTKPQVSDIVRKIKFATENKRFKNNLKKCGYRLGNGQAGEKIVKVLKNIKINEKLLRKRLTKN
jgi:UDP-hydrolysing UDP-N-acetyl-D-glucosamine 2-epimerase